MSDDRIHNANNFDFLRLLFALLVIVTHSYLLTGTMALEPLMTATRSQLDFAGLAVDGFFIISGYLISKSWNQNTPRAFFSKRVRRIYPGFICALIVSVFIFAPLGGTPLAVFLGKEPYQFIYRPLLFRDLWLTIPGFCVTNYLPLQLNSSLWTIRFEIFCYGLVAILGFVKILRVKVACGFIFALCLAAYGLHLKLPDDAYLGEIETLPRLTSFFLAGVFLSNFKRTELLKPGVAIVCTMLILMTISSQISNWIFPLSLAYLVIFLALCPMPYVRSVAKHGDISYGIYLYAWPVQQLYANSFTGHPLLHCVVSSLSTIPIAALSWRLVENRFLKKKNTHALKTEL